ncbi:hypothetical protein P7C70_g7042, partial [Phenoliferia sp. Uapishka_3]
MSFFTNPFAPSSPVPVFASSPLNPLPNSTYPLPSNLRRTSLVRVSPSSAPAHLPSLSDTSSSPGPTAHASGSGSSLGSSGGVTFISPFAAGSAPAKGGPSPGAPAHATGPNRRSSNANPSPGRPRSSTRGSSHSRAMLSPDALSPPGSRRGSMQGTTTIRSPSATPVVIPFFASLNGAVTPPALSSPASPFFKVNGPVDFSRRRSVDVGVLGLGTHRSNGAGSMSKRVREAVGPDAWDKETGFVATPGLKSGKDRLLGRHLAGILAHSLSLCSDPPTTDILPEAFPGDGPLAAIPGSPATSPSTSRNTSVSGSVFSSAPSLSDTAATFDSALPPRPPAPIFPVLSEAKRFKLIGNLQSWTFNAMSYNADELLSCVGIMFESVRNMEGVSFDNGRVLISIAFTARADRFKQLLLSLRSAYHARNGYHNFSHATDVTQACYSFLVRMGLAPPLYLLCEDDYDMNIGEGRRKWRRNRAVEEGGMGELLRPMDVFALMVAAIGHDVGHPGLSNAYMVNARTPVAQVYDKSVLENFHTVTLIHMLRRHNFDYLLGGDFGHLGDQATSFRKVVEASILATDMSRHFGFVNQLNDLGRRFGERRGLSSSTVEEDRLLLCSGLIKCADISNPTRPHRISRAWSTALLDEWTVQAAIETEFGLPISVMTLDPNDTKAQAKSQVGFIDLFAKPLFNAMAGVVDGTLLPTFQVTKSRQLMPCPITPEFADFAEKLRDGRIAWEAISLATDAAFSKPMNKDWRLAAAPPGRPSSRPSSAGGVNPSTRDADTILTQTSSTSSAESSSTATQAAPVPIVISPQATSRGRAAGQFRSHHLALGRQPHHGRQVSDGSASSNSPLSPSFPGSVSTGATSAISTEGGELGSSPTTASLFARSPRNGGFYHQENKSSCGGACQAATAMCETCSRRLDPGARRESLGRALAGILATGDESDDGQQSREDYMDDEPDTWPSWCFRKLSQSVPPQPQAADPLSLSPS